MRSTKNISNEEYDEDILCKTFTKSYAPTAKCSWTHLNDMNCNTSKCKEIIFQKKNNTTQGHPTTVLSANIFSLFSEKQICVQFSTTLEDG